MTVVNRPRTAHIDDTVNHLSDCCGRPPYSINNGPWRCGCGRDVREVRVEYVAVADVAAWLRERGATERTVEEIAYVIEHPKGGG